MNSFFIAASVVVPLLIYMMVGGIIRKLNIFTVANFKALNVMLFKIFIPLAVFFDVYQADIGEVLQVKVFAYAIIGVFLEYAIAWITVSRFVKKLDICSVMIQGIYRSNFVLMGGSIAASLCGTEGRALAASLVSVVIPIYNILAVILFEVKRGGELKLNNVFLNILKNPLVIAGVLGIIFSAFQIRIPELIASPLMKLGSTATPVALVTLGGILSFNSLVEHRKYLVITTICRLLVVPGIMLSVAALVFGIRGDCLIALLALFASPTAVSSTPMAQTMGGNGELAGEIVAVSTTFCIFTIFFLVYVFSAVGFI